MGKNMELFEISTKWTGINIVVIEMKQSLHYASGAKSRHKTKTLSETRKLQDAICITYLTLIVQM